MNMSVERQRITNKPDQNRNQFFVMIWLIYDSLPFYAHVYSYCPSYIDEEQKTKVDSETVCLRL